MGVSLTSPLPTHTRLGAARHAIPRHIVAPREKHPPTVESFFLDDRTRGREKERERERGRGRGREKKKSGEKRRRGELRDGEETAERERGKT